LDLTDEASIAKAALSVTEPRLVIVATGLLQDNEMTPEKRLADLDPGRIARAFAINAIGPALVLKHFAPRLPRQGKSVLAVLTARVGSISDNRLGGWYSYRAAKAAAFVGPVPEGGIAGSTLHPGIRSRAASFRDRDAPTRADRSLPGLGWAADTLLAA